MDGNLGVRLKEERKRLLLSQHDFGALGGVAENAQGHYERGERLPKSDYLMAIRKRGVDVLYLLSGERSLMSSDDLSEQETEILNQYRTLQKQDRGAIAQITSSLSKDA
ncbi:helix-turn-helix domain-containing protein [Pseudomonas sp. O64]|uniref:helix-turn-helix domain-containing protein n=1 Tax=Pseudomonas TaxID=286 RepID=UPI000B9FFE42|nr:MULTISPECIES: helix-turn-helix transcriptional regulator [unclassified Pseudomonas]MCV2228765.1 helix-turn-helix domain-containing protein [Pseudomonas sp. AU10]OZO04956.1 transcriptional regulator [Pseudomonas sp. IB20]UNM17373.1 helix-turn-helix domain-containing protein [Pseudomonas sp. ArH3a]UXZ20161.1 helix-turn-helix domain-containing protein [Pseudomonas sp. YeP6b]